MHETITLAGGCFWCLEAVYSRIKGVTRVRSGYMGGHRENPSYEQVCTGVSGHAEVVQLEFDPQLLSLDDLLDVFFTIHDPTSKDRQGNDVGTQYRSGIYWHSAEQEATIRASVARWQESYPRPIVTELRAASTFWPAEAEHHDYYNRHPVQPYCAIIIAPKLQKLYAHFPRLAHD
ncbi:peptide-methionine (S)-S-oxide reductase MsrA [Chitinilyticum piscinae]|uniref:Peptide methionine sulfoxide reductase MsrA n=1 Tax=Chitinilyticum piscinae TaxID=2866724 RepID=A0A8J7FP97_9NEIS|nr:peptide-methionine (S)-S-oxide reductase MsrA [Chitinilyticum piscinae]MBE9609704.1 peptide-methionine (S)-S-oxide reductase MsrA [Chitinilyticum piscinae]